MKISLHLDLTDQADAAILNMVLGQRGAALSPRNTDAPAPAAPTPVAPAPAPAAPAPAPAPVTTAATAATGLAATGPAVTGLMPGMGGVPAAQDGITREALITKMASSVKSVGPAAVIERLRRDVAGFTDIPSASNDLYPQINAVLDSIIAGQ